MYRNCKRTLSRIKKRRELRRAIRWLRLGAASLALLSTASFGSSSLFAASPATERAGETTEPGLAVQSEAQTSRLRFLTAPASPAKVDSQSNNLSLSSLDEKLIAVAIYANQMHESRRDSLAVGTPQPIPAPRQSAAPDIAGLLQSTQQPAAPTTPIAAIPQPTTTSPLRIKLSLGHPAQVAAEPPAPPISDELPASDDSQSVLRSVAKVSETHQPAAAPEPVLPPASDVTPVAAEPAAVASEPVDVSKALAKVRDEDESPAAQNVGPIPDTKPLITASQPKATDHEPPIAIAANPQSIAIAAVPQSTAIAAIPQPSAPASQPGLESNYEDTMASRRMAMATEVRVKRIDQPSPDSYAMAPAPAPQAHVAAPSVSADLQVSEHPESRTLEEMSLPPMPLTSSNYLPATPENYCYRCGVQCPPCGCSPGGPGWEATRPIPWEVFAQGEYIGPARLAHVPIYRLRVDDRLSFVYRLSGQVAGQPYRLNVRDHILVQSLSAPDVVNRELIIQPDGTITLPLLGQVRAAGATLEELSKNLDDAFRNQIKDPRISVTPLVLNSNLEELRASVDRRYGQGGQVSDARVSPDGTVQLPAIGLVPAQGMTLEELEREVKTRYARIVEGLEVTPVLLERAPRFIFVVGEVKLPGRYTMEGPTTLMQAISLAGSWNVGAQLNHVVVFRRDDNWHLMATRVDVRSSLLFKKPCPEGEIWLRDSDIVLVPKSPILCADDFIELVFTRGIYGVFPMTAQLNFSKLSTL